MARIINEGNPNVGTVSTLNMFDNIIERADDTIQPDPSYCVQFYKDGNSNALDMTQVSGTEGQAMLIVNDVNSSDGFDVNCAGGAGLYVYAGTFALLVYTNGNWLIES